MKNFEDIETEKGSMLDSTKMDEIMSKCLAAGQAEEIIYIYISSSSFESLKVLFAC